MCLKRAILTSIVLWVGIFLLSLLVALLIRPELYTEYLMARGLGLSILVILTSIASWSYFTKPSGRGTGGLQLGILFLVMGIVLDLIIFIPYLSRYNELEQLRSYYVSSEFLLAALFTLLVPFIVKTHLERSSNEH